MIQQENNHEDLNDLNNDLNNNLNNDLSNDLNKEKENTAADENQKKNADFCRLLLLNIAKDGSYIVGPEKKYLVKKDFGALNVLFLREINLQVTEIVKQYFENFTKEAGYKGNYNGTFYRFINIAIDYEELRPVYEPLFKEIENTLFEARIMCEIDIIDLKTGKVFGATGGTIKDKKLLKIVNATINNKEPFDKLIKTEAESIIKKSKEIKSALAVRKFNPIFNVSNIIIAINVLIFIVDMFMRRTGNYNIINFGVQDNGLVKSGQWWRLITSMFLHADVTHIVGNMVTLWIIGKIILKYYNSAEFLSIYFLGGLFGNILGLLFLQENAVSLGASGAIMALGGVIIYRSFFGKYRRYFRKTGNYLAVAIVILYNLVYGLFQTDVDNYGHFGGFIIGFIAAFILEKTIKNNKKQDKI